VTALCPAFQHPQLPPPVRLQQQPLQLPQLLLLPHQQRLLQAPPAPQLLPPHALVLPDQQLPVPLLVLIAGPALAHLQEGAQHPSRSFSTRPVTHGQPFQMLLLHAHNPDRVDIVFSATESCCNSPEVADSAGAAGLCTCFLDKKTSAACTTTSRHGEISSPPVSCICFYSPLPYAHHCHHSSCQKIWP
jgi:hypothetical protein